MAFVRELKAKHTRCQGCLYPPPEAVRGRALHVHHVQPLELGGTDDPENLAVLCARCHSLAHAILKQRPKAKPEKWRLLRRLLVLESKRREAE